MSGGENITRRPLKSRDTKWAAPMASWLARAGIRPNVISVAGAVFAAGAGICFWLAGGTGQDWRWSVLLIWRRAECNCGCCAICSMAWWRLKADSKPRPERSSMNCPIAFRMRLFSLARDIPCRNLGGRCELGWTAAVLSLITAYVRALGASMGAGQQFVGPMAKQQRMAAMTAACVIGALAPLWPVLSRVIPAGAGIGGGGLCRHDFPPVPADRAGNGVKKMTKALLVAMARLVSGANVRWAGCAPEIRQRVYFANHTSNLDALVVWASLPPPVRALTRPVAARDYWIKGPLRRYLANQVFNAVLIERKKPTAHDNPLADMLAALGDRHSLIIFPEGGRQPGMELAPFKGGLVSSRQRPAGCGICAGAD